MSQNEIYGDVSTLTQIEKHWGSVVITSGTGEKDYIPFLAPPPLPHKLVGRDDLLRELKDRLLSGGDSALLILKGMPGVGKTALAVTLANDKEVLKHFRGVLWAGLGPKADTLTLLGAWARSLGISTDELSQLTDVDERLKAVRSKIGMRRMLIVIDDAWDLATTSQLRLGGPNCVHLVTTRQGEVAQDFPNAEVREVKELSEADGLELLTVFAPDATEENPGGAKELVKIVGQLPLALVLIGKHLRAQRRDGHYRIFARLQQQVKQRLKLEVAQYPSGHPGLPKDVPLSLLAVIGTSDQALDKKTRRKLRSLAVLPPKPNTFSEKAALIVAAARVETLYKLVNYGLLEKCGDERYSLHQTISDYAKFRKRHEKFLEIFLRRERLAHKRMISFFVEYVEEHQTDYSVLVLETGNVLAALQAAFEHRMYETFVRGASAFGDFLQTKGWYKQAEEQLHKAAKAASSLGDSVGLAKIWLSLGRVEESRGNYLNAERYLKKGLQISRLLEKREKIDAELRFLTLSKVLRGTAGSHTAEALTCDLLRAIGVLARNRTDYAQAEEHLQQALDIARRNKDDKRTTVSLHLLASVARNRGAFEKAEEKLLEAMSICRRVRDAKLNWTVSMGLAMLEVCRRNYEQAEEYLKDALKAVRQFDDPEKECFRFYIESAIACARVNYEKAEDSLQKGIDLAREIGHTWYISALLIKCAELELKKRKLALASGYFEDALLEARKIDGKDLWACAAYGLARVCAEKSNISDARHYGQQSLRTLQEIGHYMASEVKSWLSNLQGPAAVNRTEFDHA